MLEIIGLVYCLRYELTTVTNRRMLNSIKQKHIHGNGGEMNIKGQSPPYNTHNMAIL
jgi:hypothetical protein